MIIAEDHFAETIPVRSVVVSLGLLFALLSSGCAGPLVKVAPLPPAKYERLGHAKGSACGTLGIVSTAYYVIPIMLGSRVERAYQEALGRVPGATGLVDVKLSESWFWWVLATTRCMTIEGEAIR